MPIITLEVLPDSTIVESGNFPDNYYGEMETTDAEMQEFEDGDTKAGLILNYMDETENNLHQETYEEYTHANLKNMILDMESPRNRNISKANKKDDSKKNAPSAEENLKVRDDHLEYSVRSDGSVHCKICGKIYANRHYWQRHKYKAHADHSPADPASLFKCEKCLVYFKSRKGFLGHMSSKHSDTFQDVTPVLRNEQAAAILKEQDAYSGKIPVQLKRESDPETTIPKTIVQNSPASAVGNIAQRRSTDKKSPSNGAKAPDQLNEREYQEKRDQDTKFVMKIIDRVKREFTNKPTEVSGRRGYTRKPYATKNRQS